MTTTFEEKFRPSLVSRAKKRTVTAAANHYTVDGDTALGDSLFAYQITLNPETHRYHCTCHESSHGATRARNICSHVLAVILYRQDHRSTSVPSAGDGDAAVVLGDATAAPRVLVGVDGMDGVTPAPARSDGSAVVASTSAQVSDLDVPSPHQPLFRNKLPQWVESIRPHQWRAVLDIIDAFDAGAKCVFLDAPTGAGKTLIARMVSIIMDARSVYVCSDKSLQDQFTRDFDSAVLKGRTNYIPTDAPTDTVTCGDCTATSIKADDCAWCDSTTDCPYNKAKMHAIRHELAVLNTSYLLAEGNGGQTAFGNRQRALIVVDECVPAGTMIATPDGERPIEDIKVGDWVLGHEFDGGRFTRVTKTWASDTTAPLVIVNGVTMTANHPVWTCDGYVPAGRIDSALSQGMRMVRQGVAGEGSHPEVLFEIVPLVMELVGEPGEDGRRSERISGPGASHARGSGEVASVAEGPAESDTSRVGAEEGYGHSARTWLHTPDGRQWYGTDRTATAIGRTVGLGNGVRRDDGPPGVGVSTLLQDRHSQPEDQNGGGGGRRIAPEPEDPRHRRAQDGVSGSAGMDGAAVRQQRSDGGRGAGGVQVPVRVHNLSTGTHNYVAGGILVHNCDGLESQLMGYVECVIGDRRAAELDLGRPQFVTKPESVADWVRDVVVPKVDAAIKAMPKFSSDLRTIRKKQSLTRLADNLKYVEPGLRSGNWIFDGYNKGGAVFKPVRVDQYGPEVLWRHADKWLLMSATIISADELAESLGLDGQYQTVTVPMTFPVENRRIHIAGVADMTAKKAAEEWPKMAVALAKILEKHPTDRCLVHVVSYKLAEYLDAQLLDRRVMTYRGAAEREKVLAKFRATEGAVLLAPSMARGVDLKDEDCRVVVVAKMPYLYLGDKQVAARMHSRGGQTWYSVQTARSLVQMTGRGVRSIDDWCVSYILDAQFVQNFHPRSKNLLPAWWSESLDWEFPVRSLR